MMPAISFLGHLSGILVGMLQVSGLLSPILPSQGEPCLPLEYYAMSLLLFSLVHSSGPQKSTIYFLFIYHTACLKRMEASVILSPITRNSKYVPCPDILSIEASG